MKIFKCTEVVELIKTDLENGECMYLDDNYDSNTFVVDNVALPLLRRASDITKKQVGYKKQEADLVVCFALIISAISKIQGTIVDSLDDIETEKDGHASDDFLEAIAIRKAAERSLTLLEVAIRELQTVALLKVDSE